MPRLEPPRLQEYRRSDAVYSRTPLQFEANRGQSDDAVKFLAHSRGYNLWLAATEMVLAPAASTDQDQRQALVRLQFVGAAPNPNVVGLDRLPGVVNYYLGRDAAHRRTGIPTYARVKYQEVYPGVDVMFYGNEGHLEHDFVVSPRRGGNPRQITLSVKGADGIQIDRQGDLVLDTAGGEVRLRKPFLYQEVNGQRRQIAGGYVLKGPQAFGFAVGAYDRSRPLIIDPVLVFSTHYGAENDEEGRSIALDDEGNIYITGATNSVGFPLENPTQPDFGGGGIDCPSDQVATRLCYDTFVMKLDPTGSTVVYATYIGDQGSGIAVDADGNVYVTGARFSLDFPTVRPLQDEFGGGNFDALVVKLNADGSDVVYATFMGGGGDDEGYGIAVAAELGGLPDAYITRVTGSQAFPTEHPLQPRAQRYDVFISHIADMPDADGNKQCFLPLIQTDR
jgi:hypothetical protein